MPESIQVLFNRFLNRECTRQELEALFSYFGTTDEETLRQLIRRELEAAQYESDQSPEREEKLHQLYQKISTSINQPETGRKTKFVALRRVAAAAAVIMAIAAGYYIWSGQQTTIKTVYAAYGKVLKVVLPDRSVVWLNAGSTLQYPTSFNGNERPVVLSNGGAYFEVTPDKHKPFHVTAGKMLVTVLGTAFEVSDYDKESEAKVSVIRGKVSVALLDKKVPPVLLIPGERAVIAKAALSIANADTAAIHKTMVSTGDIAVWREQRLVFDDQPLADVMQQLERKYNVHIDIRNPELNKERVTVRLNNEPLTDVLTALGFSNHFKYTIHNDSMVIIR